MRTVFDLLDAIRQRPSMFVGGGPEDIKLRLDNLQVLIDGYDLALQMHDIDEPGRDFSRNLAYFMHRQFNTCTSCGPIAAIRSLCESDVEAWERLWEVIDKFRVETYPSAPQ